MLKIDHVALCSTNLYETAYQLRDECGLESYEGGYFRGGGVAQRVVPLGNDQYIEIESVIDPDEARRAEWGNGRYIMEQVVGGPKLLAFWILTDDIEGEATRLGVKIWNVQRTKPDGTVRASRTAPPTIEAMTQGLPPFFAFEDMENHAARTLVKHRVQPTGIAWLELGGPEKRIQEWLGPEADSLPLRLVGGAPGIRAMAIATTRGEEIVLRPRSDRLTQ